MSQNHIVLKASGGALWMGGREYTRNLIRALITVPSAIRDQLKITVMLDRGLEGKYYEEFVPLVDLADSENVQLPYTFGNKVRWKLKRATMGQINPRLQEYLLRIGATFAFPIVTALPDKQPFRSANWIPDFQYRHFPNGAPESEVSERKRDAQRIVTQSQLIALSSEHAERDCHELFPQSKEKTCVLRFRVSVEPSAWELNPETIRQHYNLPARFFLVSNMLSPTKNHRFVLQALQQVKSTEPDVCVAFTGDIYDYRNHGFYNGFLAAIHELNVSAHVKLLGLIPKQHQFQLLRCCQAYIQPSLFEGWHTGVEESHHIGKRILLSNIPVHLEQNPPNAHYFDPEDPQQLAEQILRAMHEPIQFDRELELAASQAYAHLRLKYADDFLQIATNASVSVY